MANTLGDLVTSNGVTYFLIYFFTVRPCCFCAGGPESDFLDKFPPKFLNASHDEVSQLSLATPNSSTNIAVLDNGSHSVPEANVADIFIWASSTAQQNIVRTKLSKLKKLLGGRHDDIVHRRVMTTRV